jgi:hypothetical protein
MASNELSCNDFKKAFEAEFGKCEFKAVSADKTIVSKGFVSDDGLKVMPELVVIYRAEK